MAMVIEVRTGYQVEDQEHHVRAVRLWPTLRHVTVNSIQGVRCSGKRLKEPDVLRPAEFNALLKELPQRERVMVLLAGTTGLRRSELIALTWEDIDFDTHQIVVNKSCVRAQMDETKTAASAKPVPLHPVLAEALGEGEG